MEKLFRFSDYDLFGYLASGLISFALYDVTFGTQFVLREEWSISSAVSVIIAGYITGHIVSGLAALVIDRGLVRRGLGTPADILMRPPKSKISLFQRALFGDFLEPLHPDLRDRLLRRAGMSTAQADRAGAGEIIFWRAWPTIKREPIPYGRADVFIKLYGFCRTVCLISLVAAVLFAIKAFSSWAPVQNDERPYLMWSIGAAIVSLVMFRRYLRFFRLYSLEVFSTFADSPNDR
jgi:hypothetical protein